MMPVNTVTNQAGVVPESHHQQHIDSAPGRLAEPGAAALKRHTASIEDISDAVSRPFGEVASVYQLELLRMAAAAAVTEYLPVLVSKRVRAFYRREMEARASVALSCCDRSDPCVGEAKVGKPYAMGLRAEIPI